MGNDGGVSCASWVMMVMAMTVNCGGGDGAIDDSNVVRSPSPMGPLHRASRKQLFPGHAWDAKPVFPFVSSLLGNFARRPSATSAEAWAASALGVVRPRI